MKEICFKRDNENDIDYILRLIKNKNEYDLDYVELFNLCFNIDLAPDECRKRYYGMKMLIDKIYNTQYLNIDNVNLKEQINLQIEELKKERIRISEERNSLNRRLRDKVKSESIAEIALECANIISKSNKFNNDVLIYEKGNNKNAAILTLSDIHYGLEIKEFNNFYNSDICESRLKHLEDETKKIIDRHSISTLYVLGLGDYIEGIIHNINRIESRENIISQIINISELIANLLYDLSQKCKIIYYDVADNHSRAFADKDDSLNKDNFSLLIKWYLKSRFKDNKNIIIKDNDVNESIGTVNILNHNFCFVHGNRDKVGDVVQNLSLMTKKFYEGVFIGHCHHFEANEIHGTYVYMNGTFAGNDEYSNNIRKTSNPSQNIFVVNENNGIECQYLIKL